MKKIQHIFAALLAGLLFLNPIGSVVFATEEDESRLEELEEQRQEVAEQEYETNLELEETRQKVNEMFAAIKEIDDQISASEAQIRDLEERISDNQAVLEKTMTELDEAKETEAVWYQKLKLRLKAIYESGEVNYMEVLLRASSMSELFSKAEYTRQLAQFDQDILTNLETAREDVQAKKQQVEEKEAELEQNRTDEEARKQELQKLKEQKDEELASLQDDEAALELCSNELRAQREDLAAELAETAARIEAARKAAEEEAARQAAAEEAARKAAEEAARKAAEEAERQKAAEEAAQQSSTNYTPRDTSYDSGSDDSGSDYSGSYSGMIWPLPGYSYLSTYFAVGGHRGIDIPAPSGTPILASAGGTVIKSQWNDSYGYYVAISHGNGMVTVYAHASALCVSVGDTVSAGSTIALVGTTGYSTGNHLHFEVQINGSLYNPLNYVSP